jgi:dipeptidase E
MNLVLYSDQIIPENRRIDEVLLSMLPPQPRIGYVPSAVEPRQEWFESRRAYYAKIGLPLQHFHDPVLSSEDSLAALLSCDAIHLSGGDTRHFHSRLIQANLMRPLREYASRGGIIIGTSAGAILTTPTIALDAIFSDSDPTLAGPSEGLSLVEFEFFPHLHADPSYLPRLLEYSRASERPILACPDGSGVAVYGSRLHLIGDGLRIRRGNAEDWTTSSADLAK